ncbi:MAG: hypothetical protein RSD88_00740 [Anaerovoracaceae bacterium]
MKKLNYYFYGLALILVLIPIGMEQMHYAGLTPMLKTFLLCSGLASLVVGKTLLLLEKRKQEGVSYFLDIVIIVCLIVMIGWIILKQ